MAGWMNLGRSRWLAGLAMGAACALSAKAAVVSHWSFDAPDEAGAYADFSGRTASPADKSAISVVDGKFGKAVSFNGEPNSFLTIPPIDNIQKSSFTVAAWVRFNTPGPNYILTDWQSFPQAGFVFGVNPLNPRDKTTAQPIADLASAEVVRTGRSAGNHLSVVRQQLPNKPVPLNEWHHMTWTWDRDTSTLTYYLDGDSIGETKKPTSGNFSKTLDLAVNDRPMRIGSQELAVSGTQPTFNGAIDELWVFDTALTPIQIGNLVKNNDIRGAVVVAAVAPTPAPPKPKPTPTPAVPSTPVTPSMPAVVAPTVPESVAPTVTPSEPRGDGEVRTASTPLSSTPGQITPLRMTGIVTGLFITVAMSGYLIWAVLERAKLRAAGHL